MGWQDRDYAQESDAGYGGGRPWSRGRSALSLVTSLIAVNVGIFLVGALAGPGSPVQRLVYGWGVMSTQLVLHGQVWRLITSQYLHASTTHLLFNMLGLYFFGQPLERVWGPKKLFVIYTLSGLAGNLLLMLIGVMGWIDPGTPALGASGCVLGLLGLCAVLFPHAEVLVYFLFPVRIRTAAIVLALGYAYNIWRQGSNYGGDACHLAGLAFGVWYGKSGALWWQIRGRRWWGKLFRESGGQRGTPRVRGTGAAPPGAWERRMDQRKEDAELVDRLLAKVYEGGLHSLSPQERHALIEATERQRQAEAQAGRTDRL